MRHFVLGTAGHIDHGKTELIKALTGIDCDRLIEEKRRGITIDLGFAHMELPGGDMLGIVDVPGHERFVKNMVAGATGIDLVALVIAADEGVMPQTREHLSICSLLGIKRGVVVITKKDLVDNEWLQLVVEDVKDFVKGTFLEGAPMVIVSSSTGEGLDELKRVLADLVASLSSERAGGRFRLPVDRVFTIKGFGTVVTGTTISGRISVGDEVMIYPAELVSRVRSIQIHGRPVQTAEGGFRTAINLQGVDKSDIRRGDVLAPPDSLKPTSTVDAWMIHLESAPRGLKNRSVIRLHAGTSEVIARVLLLDRDELLPGEEGPVQFKLERKISVLPGDRFVIRSYSPITTIGGGEFLSVEPRKYKRKSEQLLHDMAVLRNGDKLKVVKLFVDRSGYRGISRKDLFKLLNLTETEIESVTAELENDGALKRFDRDEAVFVSSKQYLDVKNEIIRQITEFHKKSPIKAGMPKEVLKASLPKTLDYRIFSSILDQLLDEGVLVQEEGLLRHKDHSVHLDTEDEKVVKEIEDLYLRSGLQPPTFKELVEETEKEEKHLRNLLELLTRRGALVKTKEDLYFHRRAVDDLEKRLREFLEANGEIGTSQFKELTGVSRKFMIPLGEYFDKKKVTLRIGDKRVLVK